MKPNETRPADTLIEESAKKLTKRLSLIANKKIKFWKALLIIVFVAGFATSLAWSISTDTMSKSQAASTKIKCSDSDGGKIIELEGVCQDNKSKTADYCVDNKLKPVLEGQKIREYYCDSKKDKCAVTTVKCPKEKTCKDGACVAREDSFINLQAEYQSSLPASFKLGDNVKFNAIIKNIGTKNSLSNKVRFCVDQSNCGQAGDQNLTGQIGQIKTVKSIVGGGNKQTQSDEWPATQGNHILYVCADILNTNQESNEQDNCGTYNFVISSEFGYCKELIPGINNPSANRLNLIFTGINNDLDTIKSKAMSFLDWDQTAEGLFTIEPFKSRKDRFNFWFINKINNIENPDDYRNYISKLMSDCSLPNWYGYVYINDSGRSFIAGSGPNNASAFIYNNVGVGGTIHETGHLIGNLADEYISGILEDPMRYYHDYDDSRSPLMQNLFYSSALDTDNFISVAECRENTQWKNWIGKGCGSNDSIDCIDKYVFHKAYRLLDKNPSDSTSIDLLRGVLEDEYCDYGNEDNCFITLNGNPVNPFNPGEGFTSVVQENNGTYRQEMFNQDLLCKPGYGWPNAEMGNCLDEIDCFQGGEYMHYNVYRQTFQSRMRGGVNFGVYNEFLIQQQIDKYSK